MRTEACDNPDCKHKSRSWRTLYEMLPELVGMEDKRWEAMNG